ncbi:hypothetical protein [Helicobacter sp. 11S03491-1]|uniref:hypothetical protein n=1 Tax=Helicobacter sp. 11S03491-1 TaxID=1476196 RepID=UPI000BA78646|nr:hypothetical protein [Helicobacter sp. 11S03491-1]PAF41031.1 hypothetical protein BKH45_08625 [Helicobacter sp. 11S03491-1]
MVCVISCIFIACSSPQEKKPEKDTGYKLSEINKALKVQEELQALNKVIPTNFQEGKQFLQKNEELNKQS